MPPGATKRRKAAPNCGSRDPAAAQAGAVRSAISALRRKSVACREPLTYSPFRRNEIPQRKDRAMKAKFAATLQVRAVSFLLAVVASATVLGATVLSMQPRYEGASPQVMALERVVVKAGAVN
jgi:hypothetical protein